MSVVMCNHCDRQHDTDFKVGLSIYDEWYCDSDCLAYAKKLPEKIVKTYSGAEYQIYADGTVTGGSFGLAKAQLMIDIVAIGGRLFLSTPERIESGHRGPARPGHQPGVTSSEIIAIYERSYA